ncbi:MAG: hypothetical protein C5B47_02200 [Verrucomicrobia bacterium]|nr:MAG: hypothetical protein C5B47_02200 [Verrucomicrobiota bacterium]
MNKPVEQVAIRGILPAEGSCAVFLGNEKKTFVIYVDAGIGAAIGMFLNGTVKDRPLTHDLFALMLAAFGARVERVVINQLKGSTYYGRLIIAAENEIQQRKIVELDARPSDCLAMAAQQPAPIYVSKEVWDEVEDMSDVLRGIEEERQKEGND